jgi:hypothetical protein
MGRTLGMLLFVVSLTAAAQVTIQGGYAVQNPTTTPILAPPNVALPGSGTPTGAPLDINANNARLNATGAVYTPGVVASSGGMTTSGAAANNSDAATSAPAAGNTASGTSPRVMGLMTTFIPDHAGPRASAPAPVTSLGEIAAKYRRTKGQPVDRHLDNADVLALNNTATFRGQTVELPQSDQPPLDENGNPIGQPRAAGEQTGDQQVLDPNDLRDVEAAVQRSKERQQRQPAQPQPQQQPR